MFRFSMNGPNWFLVAFAAWFYIWIIVQAIQTFFEWRARVWERRVEESKAERARLYRNISKNEF